MQLPVLVGLGPASRLIEHYSAIFNDARREVFARLPTPRMYDQVYVMYDCSHAINRPMDAFITW